ncbi:uncharacterized protein LOC118433468 [Folsomia candida]|uniref:uncharacterized protein LOC118433468 n=1 Tax=Folsomia candida TaxID=158441 RepID=UPI001604BB3E|nr:uncharacterized protein LOC118433468 [Folsomia candida]
MCDAEIQRLLTQLNLGKYCQLFKDNNLTDDSLQHLQKDDLIHVVPVLGDRILIWNGINKLQSGSVYVCFVCEKRFKLLKLYSDHLKNDHKLLGADSHRCVHCGGLYQRKPYISHLKNAFKFHKLLLSENFLPENYEERNPPIENMKVVHADFLDRSFTKDCDNDINKELRELIFKLIAGILRSGKVPMSTKDEILTLIKEFTVMILGEAVCRSIIILKSNETLSEKLFKLEQIKNLAHVFSSFDSKHKLDKLLIDGNLFIPAREIVLDTDLHFPLKIGNQRQVYRPIKLQYVSIRDSIFQLLQKPGFYDILDKQQSYSGRKFSSFRDGKFFRDSNFPSQVIFINIYFDEAEVANPLGSKNGKHKLANFYYSIQDMPCHYNSSIENIILLCSLKSEDLKILSPNSVMNIIVKELLFLWETGINFNHNGKTINIKVALSQISGDNLGLHTILGFSEGFNANYPCRRCKMHKHDCQTAVTENPGVLRSIENYNQDVEFRNLSATGINFESVINSLPYHHVTKVFVFDIMHDLLEGVVPDLLNLMISLGIKNKRFNLDKLNYRIESFDYGRHFRRSKPSQIKASVLKGDTKSGQNASQNLCLLVSLPLILGDLMPHDDPVWKLFLLLREICDIILSHIITKGGLIYLDSLISEFCCNYQELFKRKLKPKHHHLLHYSGSIVQIGSLRQYWSMTYEARHKVFKTTAHTVCNFKNIPKTLAYRHQLGRCFSLISKNVFSPCTFVVPKYEFIQLNDFVHAELVADHFHFQENPIIKISNLVESNNSEFRVGGFVILKYCTLFPEFGKIEGILLEDDDCTFIVTEFSSKLVTHLSAYQICKSNKIRLVDLHAIKHYQPLYTMHSFFDNDVNEYISVPFKLV